MSDYIEDNDKNVGQIQIADEVIAIIAGTAASEVEGVEPVGGMASGGIFSKKNLAKGIKVKVEEGTATIEAEIAVIYGIKITEAAELVQEKIKNAVENMTGLAVDTVNVNVSSIIVNKLKSDKETE
ncbi:MAG: Asp23/Gls24 family envelope stress response protein [Clostridia bacterium]|jgi:uncharacterized alkaline shock family protein YloU|nr:Asp23/Gls24 family envelope stress response protein [Clostridia bacterium]MCI1959523.1 Asp23/Gls24 family envelope stress response protein [Clostridia bacterium]MCI2000937.1 Asp23/Gls24 family envelope stress response protein [Clostridia bacterium]MCI2015721.1 Asp23/Gls24 family envelope stress response protein [Clostridia bacterium]